MNSGHKLFEELESVLLNGNYNLLIRSHEGTYACSSCKLLSGGGGGGVTRI